MLKKWLFVPLFLSVLANGASAGFMNGPSVGLNLGYHFNSAQAMKNPPTKLDNYGNSDLGLHFDYNSTLSQVLFMGTGLEIGCALNHPKIKVSNDKVTFKRTVSGAGVFRIGTTAGPVAFDVNGAILFAQWKFGNRQSPSQTQERLRFGFGPGVAATVAFAPYVSCGLAYRFETYPKGSSAPRFEGHLVLLKLNYHF